MNNEKMQALFNSSEMAVDELKKASSALRRATAAANTLRIDNEKEQKISTLIEEFEVIQQNCSDLKVETNKSIRRMEKQGSFPKLITLFVVLIFTSIVGLGLGYYTFTTQLKDLVYKNYLKKDFGVVVYPNGITLPDNYRTRLRKTDKGVYYIHKMGLK